MTPLFYLAAAVAVASTLLVITGKNAVHALLYFVVSLFAVALIFFLLGAPFVAALEVIVYAGAIMVLFVFVVMLLNQGPEAADREWEWMPPRIFVGPSILAVLLLAELLFLLWGDPTMLPGDLVVEPREVGATLLGPYLLAVELASILLLAGLVGAYHLGRRNE
ncbi:MAG: NADH-quinone oxidoreductase subunit J [Thermoanaerobaculia bacterium]|nr:NADH-quinone oxidoreductase subunit J [Thermoanaerobaculia bacterium]